MYVSISQKNIINNVIIVPKISNTLPVFLIKDKFDFSPAILSNVPPTKKTIIQKIMFYLD